MKFLAVKPTSLWILLAVLVLFPVYVISTIRNPWFDSPPKPIGDGPCYECIGQSLFSGGGFRENYASQSWAEIYRTRAEYRDFLNSVIVRDLPATGRPPLLPLLIAACYCLLGRGPAAWMVVRLILACCLAMAGTMAVASTVSLLSQRTKRLGIIALGALACIGLAASQRTLRDYASDFLTEPLALLWVQGFILLAITWPASLAHRSWSRLMLAGFLLAAMGLTRSILFLWFPGVIFLLAMTACTTRTERIHLAARLATITVLLCLPWWTYNCITLERWMPLGTQGAVALVGGYSTQAYEDQGNWSFQPELQLRHSLQLDSTFQAASDLQRELMIVDRSRLVVRQWTRENWALLPQLALKRAITHWNPYSGRALLWKILYINGAVWALLYAGRHRWILLGLPLLSTLVTMSLYETGGRFLVPLYGLLFTLGGLGTSVWLIGRKIPWIAKQL